MRDIQRWDNHIGIRGKRMVKEGDLANYAYQKENTNPLKIQERRSLNIIGNFGLQLEDCYRLKAKVVWWKPCDST